MKGLFLLQNKLKHSWLFYYITFWRNIKDVRLTISGDGGSIYLPLNLSELMEVGSKYKEKCKEAIEIWSHETEELVFED